MINEDVHKLCLIELIRIIRENAEDMLLNSLHDDENIKQEKFRAYYGLMIHLIHHAKKFEIDVNEMPFDISDSNYLPRTTIQKIQKQVKQDY